MKWQITKEILGTLEKGGSWKTMIEFDDEWKEKQ